MTEMVIPSHGEKLFGVFYQASGPIDHPTVVLLHGFPGYEQNLDLAQAIRRAGWNVLAAHYRGSWGVGGTFSITHALEDADSMVAFVRSAEIAAKYHIDRNRVVVIGHSMGAYLAASATANDPAVLAVIMMGTWDITAPTRDAPGLTRDQLIAHVEKENGNEPGREADFLPLHGFDERTLALEIVDHSKQLDLMSFAHGIGSRPVLMITSNDLSGPGSASFEQALRANGNTEVRIIHAATDHGFSGKRIYLQTIVLNWLTALPSTPKS